MTELFLDALNASYAASFVVLAVILSFLWFHKLLGVREGTIITAVLAGRLVGVFKKPLGPIVDKICFTQK